MWNHVHFQTVSTQRHSWCTQKARFDTSTYLTHCSVKWACLIDCHFQKLSDTVSWWRRSKVVGGGCFRCCLMIPQHFIWTIWRFYSRVCSSHSHDLIIYPAKVLVCMLFLCCLSFSIICYYEFDFKWGFHTEVKSSCFTLTLYYLQLIMTNCNQHLSNFYLCIKKDDISAVALILWLCLSSPVKAGLLPNFIIITFALPSSSLSVRHIKNFLSACFAAGHALTQRCVYTDGWMCFYSSQRHGSD